MYLYFLFYFLDLCSSLSCLISFVFFLQLPMMSLVLSMLFFVLSVSYFAPSVFFSLIGYSVHTNVLVFPIVLLLLLFFLPFASLSVWTVVLIVSVK